MKHINLEAMIYEVMYHHGPCKYCLFPYDKHVWQKVENAEGSFNTKLMCPGPFGLFDWEYHESA